MWLPLAIVNTKSLDVFQLISSETWPGSNMSCLWIEPTERWGDTTEIKTERHIFQDIQRICFLWLFMLSFPHSMQTVPTADTNIACKLASLSHVQRRNTSSNLTYIYNCTNWVNLWYLLLRLISDSIIAYMFSAFSDILLFNLYSKVYWNPSPDWRNLNTGSSVLQRQINT